MSYPIKLTNNSALITPTMPTGVLLDGTLDTSTGITLIGRNFTNFGDFQNENFVHLLENFAASSAPSATTPLKGMLWYDSGNRLLKVYNGTNFYPVSQRTVANSAPTADNVGDQWWDLANQQLNTWTGTAWTLIGPQHTVGQGISGSVVELVTDTASVPHTVVKTYTNGNVIAISSYDATFTPQTAITGFANISPGINLASNVSLAGTAANSITVGGIAPASFARVDQNSAFTNNVSVAQTLTIGTYGNVSVTGNDLVLQNNALGGNISIYVNSGIGVVRALSISGTNGLVSVAGDPTTSTQIATKNYVDGQVGTLNTNITNVSNILTADITAVQNNYLANISSVVVSTNSNLNSATSSINSSIAVLNANVGAFELYANANSATQATQINNLNNLISYVANIASPAFTGNPTAPAVPALTNYLANIGSLNYAGLGNNSSSISTTAYVDATANILFTDYNSKITSATGLLNAAIVSNVANLAPKASPTFTGTVTAPTPPTGDNSGNVATTAFVQTATANQLTFIVSNSAPSGTPGYNFWFQV